MGHAYNFRETTAPAKMPKTGPKVLTHIVVAKAKSGGHVATHEFAYRPGGATPEPEPHVFGPAEGPQLLAHLSKHLGIKAPAPMPAVDRGGANALEQ